MNEQSTDMSTNLFGVCTLLRGEPTKLDFDLVSISGGPLVKPSLYSLPLGGKPETSTTL